MDMGIPAMTKCCNQLDMCYDTCGSNKYRCDSKFRWCLHSICSDLKKSLGFVSKVEGQWNLKIFIVNPKENGWFGREGGTNEARLWMLNTVLSVCVFPSQRVKRWQTPCSTQCGLWAADPTWTAREQHVTAKGRKKMNFRELFSITFLFITALVSTVNNSVQSYGKNHC